MSTIKYIVTKRSYESWPSWDLVYEWEDCLTAELGLTLLCSASFLKKCPRLRNLYIKLLPWIERSLLRNGYIFRFDMHPYFEGCEVNDKRIIPCIIDFYLSQKDLARFDRWYGNFAAVAISNRQAYEWLMENKQLCPNVRLVHLPLSISDIYQLRQQYTKEYDVVLMGRQNPILEQFFHTYVQSRASVSYVYRRQVDNNFLYYTNAGTLIGDCNNRASYMELMRKARIGLYAPPGIDGDEQRCNGFSQVTPRFLEYISCGCHIIARYVKNSDTTFYEIEKFCASIETYEQFEKAMDYALSHEVDIDMYKTYLSKHYTSDIAKQIEQIAKAL